MIELKKIVSLLVILVCCALSAAQTMQYRIARPTTNLNKIKTFYTEALNLQMFYEFKNHDGFDGIMIGLPNEEYHLEFVYHPKFSIEETRAPSKENLLVFYFTSIQEYKDAITRIEKFGKKEVQPDNPYWIGKGKTYEDPDGWRIVFFKPRD